MEPYQQLEQEWAAFNGLDPAGMVACSSGTAALHLALESFQLPLGSIVLCPDLTMISCARAITLAGLEPRLVDCNHELLMDTALLPPGNGVRKTIMAVHVYGRRCNMDAIQQYRDNWPSTPTLVIEDLAEAHGVRPHAGTDAACWSFYKNKIIAGEEGGAVWFRNPEAATLARCLRSVGFTAAHDMTHVPRGHNYRLSNLHAKVILDSLRYHNPTARRVAESIYDDLCPLSWKMPRREAPWVYDIRINWMSRLQQDRVVHGLSDAGIAARHGFKPVSSQQEYRSAAVYSLRSVAQLMANEVIYLPINSAVTPGFAELAFATIKKMLG